MLDNLMELAVKFMRENTLASWIMLILALLVLAASIKKFGGDSGDGQQDDPDDEEEYGNPEVIDFSGCQVRPVCPHCKAEIKELLKLGNEGKGGDYDDFSYGLFLCSNCKAPLPAYDE